MQSEKDKKMIKYIFSIPNPASKYIDIEMQVETVSGDKTYFQLPAWRPGRYELGNFAKNIQRWNAFDENGNELKFKKVTKDKWEVETIPPNSGTKVIIRYNYFTAQLDAGGCWLDSEQLYINPIHCCFYVEGRKNESHEIKLQIPGDWKIGCGLEFKNKIVLAENYDELVDSPFIASPNLIHHQFEANKEIFHILLQGECTPDWQRIKKDFKAFIKEQINMMSDFPANGYHFLIQVLPYKFYHGVEHARSAVIAIGPGEDLMSEKLYPELVGVASHELFHTWNVKAIRPAEMLPYDYTKENYSRLGYVYEGFTTYYGDLFLARTGFFSLQQYLDEISVRLQKHMDNYGRFNYSVAQSSFDTWLDGYVPGVPGRKTSIYDEGSLIALMIDLLIRKYTGNKKSLDDVMRKLYSDFAKKHIGYTETDIIKIVEDVAKHSFKEFFDNYVYKAVSYNLFLEELLSLAGLQIKKTPSEKSTERLFGFRFKNNNGSDKVISVIPVSPADVAGLTRDDEIVFINGHKPESNPVEPDSYFNDAEITLRILTLKRPRELKLKPTGKTFYDRYKVTRMESTNEKQNQFLEKWCGYKKIPK